MKFEVRFRTVNESTDTGFVRESDAWAAYWSMVAAQADDGHELLPLPGDMLARRTGDMNHSSGWVVALVRL